ncbi:MAG: V-type ATP synthase subunit A, partial [Phycisphaerae bacterium]|nr:V-type ATP synthase subunit A [Phycisphaerae bacterium]
HQMMTVVGEEGTSVGDFTIYLKSDFFDNVYLQQNAFDEVDGATDAERQKFVFAKCLEVLRLDFGFADRERARDVIIHVADLFRNFNYAATDSDDYKKLLADIDETIATKGGAAKEEPEMANA